MKRILCLDQSTKKTGYSYWEDNSLIISGFISVCDNTKVIDRNERMGLMYASIRGLVGCLNPEFIIIEETQHQNNPKVYRTLAQMQGLIFAISFDKEIGIMTIEPCSWRKSVGIVSRIREQQKAEAIRLVEKTFDKKDLTDDEAEAISIGLWASENLKGI